MSFDQIWQARKITGCKSPEIKATQGRR